MSSMFSLLCSLCLTTLLRICYQCYQCHQQKLEEKSNKYCHICMKSLVLSLRISSEVNALVEVKQRSNECFGLSCVLIPRVSYFQNSFVH